MKTWVNFFAYEAVWFVTVYAAGRNLSWPGVLSALLFAGVQWVYSGRAVRMLDARLVGVALLLGMILDGTLAATDLVRYTPSSPALPGGAPLWMLALWASFALTLNHSLRWLRGRSVSGALLGAIGGPFAYLSASRLAGVALLVPPNWRAVACLALGWSAALGLLSYLAGRWARGLARAPPLLGRLAP
ncbi:MAG: DUF2878 domain-containing protein [Steroidobacteraceae bacterium]